MLFRPDVMCSAVPLTFPMSASSSQLSIELTHSVVFLPPRKYSNNTQAGIWGSVAVLIARQMRAGQTTGSYLLDESQRRTAEESEVMLPDFNWGLLDKLQAWVCGAPTYLIRWGNTFCVTDCLAFNSDFGHSLLPLSWPTKCYCRTYSQSSRPCLCLILITAVWIFSEQLNLAGNIPIISNQINRQKHSVGLLIPLTFKFNIYCLSTSIVIEHICVKIYILW